MNIELGSFEGRRVEESRIKLRGGTSDRVGALAEGGTSDRVGALADGETSDRVGALADGETSDRVGALAEGETVFVVVRGVVTDVGFGLVKEAFTRTHVVTATAAVIVDPEDGLRILAEAQAMADERFGIEALFRGAVEDLAHHGIDATVEADPETGEITEDDE